MDDSFAGEESFDVVVDTQKLYVKPDGTMIAVNEPDLMARSEPEKPVTSKSDTVNEPFDFNLLVTNTIDVSSQRQTKKKTLSSSAAAEIEQSETEDQQPIMIKKEITFGIDMSALQKEGEKAAENTDDYTSRI